MGLTTRCVALWSLVGGMVLAAGCASSGRLPDKAAVPWDALNDSRFLVGASQQTGDYVGQLVMLPCNLRMGTAEKMECDPQGHRPGLLIANDPVVHPLIAGEPPVQQRLMSPELQGKKVRVSGILYSDLKAILVGDVQLAR